MTHLTVIVLEAKGVPKVDPVGWADPFVQLRLTNGKVEETKVKKNEKNPIWDTRFVFPVLNKSDSLHIRLMDHDSLSADDPIGTVQIPLSKFEQNKAVLDWFPLAICPKLKPEAEPLAVRLVVELK